jgi:hypothetical protein
MEGRRRQNTPGGIEKNSERPACQVFISTRVHVSHHFKVYEVSSVVLYFRYYGCNP